MKNAGLQFDRSIYPLTLIVEWLAISAVLSINGYTYVVIEETLNRMCKNNLKRSVNS
ncbi:hypothetical protein BH18THE2_BH18THE2_28330 [soil metagenome]